MNRDGGTAELETIVDCFFGPPCIDPIFGPTSTNFYWSAITKTTNDTVAYFLRFSDGEIGNGFKDALVRVRAVRGP